MSRRTGSAYGARVGLRAVADALVGYGTASADELAAELGVGSEDRPALDAALCYWVDHGEVKVEAVPACVAGSCGGACAARARLPPIDGVARVTACRWVGAG